MDNEGKKGPRHVFRLIKKLTWIKITSWTDAPWIREVHWPMGNCNKTSLILGVLAPCQVKEGRGLFFIPSVPPACYFSLYLYHQNVYSSSYSLPLVSPSSFLQLFLLFFSSFIYPFGPAAALCPRADCIPRALNLPSTGWSLVSNTLPRYWPSHKRTNELLRYSPDKTFLNSFLKNKALHSQNNSLIIEPSIWLLYLN